MSLSRMAGRLGAVCGPLAVFAYGLHLLRPAPVLGKEAAQQDAVAQRHLGKVAIVGASFALTDVDPDVLAEELGFKPREIDTMWVRATMAPVYYAMIKERIYRNGVEPEFVILPVSISTLMVTRLPPLQMGQLMDQMPRLDDVVAEKTLGQSSPTLQGMLAHRADVRDPVLCAFKEVLPRTILGLDSEAIETATGKLFGELHEMAGGRALPAVEDDNNAASLDQWIVTDPSESYLGDMAALTDEHGARLVVVLVPTMARDTMGQYLDPDVEEAIASWAKARQITWLDMRDLGWSKEHFSDSRHMRPQAAKEFTRLIAAQIQSIDPSTGQPVGAPVLAPLRTHVDRHGSPPAIHAEFAAGDDACNLKAPLPEWAFLGRKATRAAFPDLQSPLVVWDGDTRLLQPLKKGSCSGSYNHVAVLEVSRVAQASTPLRVELSDDLPAGEPERPIYWVYPGTTLTWTVDSALDDTASVDVSVGALGPGHGVPAITSGDVTVPMAIVDGGARATLPIAPGKGQSFTITSPADGPFLVVLSAAIITGDGKRPIVREPPPRSAELFPPGSWTIDNAPPPLDVWPIKAEDGRMWFEVPWLPPRECSPLRVEVNGTLIPRRKTKDPIDSGTIHWRHRLEFPANQGTLPEAFRAVYDDDRHCKVMCKDCARELWMYPGDHLHDDYPEKVRELLGSSIVSVKLTTTVPTTCPEAASLRFRISVGDQSYLDRSLGPDDLGKSIILQLDRPIAQQDAGAITMDLDASPDLPPVLLFGQFQDR